MKRCAKCGKLPEIIKNEQGEKALGCMGCGAKIYLDRGEGNVTRAIKIWDKMQEEGKEKWIYVNFPKR